MNENKKIIISILLILAAVIVIIYCIGSCHQEAYGEELISTEIVQTVEPTSSGIITEVPQIEPVITEPVITKAQQRLINKAKKDGYDNYQKWMKKLKKVKKNSIKKINKQIKTYKKFMTSDEKTRVKDLYKKIKKSQSIKNIKIMKQKVNKTLNSAKDKKSFYDKSNHKTTITSFGGVYYYNGRKETYYSSNVLYHYRTPEWVCDDEGFWRTKEGYYVVATDSYSQGTIVHGSKGLCKVLDCGCGSNLDYYVNW